METEILKKLEEQEEKINKIYISVEKTRKYFFWTMILSLVFFILPMIGLMFAIPSFIENYVGAFSELGL